MATSSLISAKERAVYDKKEKESGRHTGENILNLVALFLLYLFLM